MKKSPQLPPVNLATLMWLQNEAARLRDENSKVLKSLCPAEGPLGDLELEEQFAAAERRLDELEANVRAIGHKIEFEKRMLGL